MRFTDINLFGVYVAPISIMMIEAWLITMVLSSGRWPLGLTAVRLASRFVRVCSVHHRPFVLHPDHYQVSSS